MSVDPTVMAEQPAPVTPSFTDTMLPIVKPVVDQALASATQATTAAITDAQARLAAVEAQVATQGTAAITSVVSGLRDDVTQLQADFTAHRAQVEEQLASAGTAVITGVVNDPTTRRDAALVLLGGVVLAGVIVLVAYLLGNPQAGRIVGGVPAAAIAIALWLSNIKGLVIPGLPTTNKS